MEVGEGDATEGGEGLGGVADPRGFAGPFAAVGFGREVRGVGFDHDAVWGDEFDGVAEVLGVFVSSDAGEGDHRAEVEDFASVGGGAGEAVKDVAGRVEWGGAEDGDQVVKSLAAMDDDGLVRVESDGAW